jgi:Fe2+ or Zn2+ uptake regulation protein
MMRPSAERLDRLHLVLLDILANHGEAMSTAALRVRADQHPRLDSPVVHEAVYNALQRLRRLGHVKHHRSQGRHTFWTATNLGAARQ